MKQKPKVYLVGAGPGAADLITVRGAELLKLADCVICDKLANPALLEYLKETAEVVYVPKRIGAGSVTQQTINEILLEKAKTRKTIVRLKGGDPGIFGRAAEELQTLVRAGIDFEIVPGITAGIAGAEYAGILLTDREKASQVIFVTGKESPDKTESRIDWKLLADFGGTIVFYMGVGTLPEITKNLLQNGKERSTPAAVIQNATYPTQRIVRSDLADIAKTCQKENIEPPAIVIIGRAAKRDSGWDWISRKPLFSKNIVVTRDHRGNARLAKKLLERGSNPILFDTIKIKPLTKSNEFLKVLSELHSFGWIVFSSANGVEIFFDSLKMLGKDARVFAAAKIAAIGPATARKLNDFGIVPDFVPEVFTSDQLGKELIESVNLHLKNVLLLRSKLADNRLAEVLTEVGAKVTQQPVYTVLTQRNEFADQLETQILDKKIDWIMFASPSAVRSFFEQIGPDSVKSIEVKIASIGPVTSKELEKTGINIDLESEIQTFEGLLDAIEGFYQ